MCSSGRMRHCWQSTWKASAVQMLECSKNVAGSAGLGRVDAGGVMLCTLLWPAVHTVAVLVAALQAVRMCSAFLSQLSMNSMLCSINMILRYRLCRDLRPVQFCSCGSGSLCTMLERVQGECIALLQGLSSGSCGLQLRTSLQL
jgi:hypothetical protein